VLTALDGWVSEQATAQGIDRSGVHFTRRSVRTHLGLSDTQLRVHLDRLVQLDYVAMHGGRPGQRFAYSLLFDGDAGTDTPQLMGLSEAAAAVQTLRGETATSRGHSANLAGGSRAVRGGVAATLRSTATTCNASADAGSIALQTASPGIAQMGTPVPRPHPTTARRLNGASTTER
jgi:hypothetical protein